MIMPPEDTGTAEDTAAATPADAPSTNLESVIETELAKPEESEEDDKPASGEGEDEGVADAGDADADEGDEPDEEPEADVPAPDLPAPAKASEDELDTDVTKPAEGKVAVKGFDGKTYYFNNVKEMPDDFEPANYKEFAVAIQELNAKAVKEAQDAEAAQKAEVEQAQATRVKTIQEGWAKEVETLAKQGTLPKDEKEREKVVNGVYDLMREEGKKGNQFPNWQMAHEVYEHRQAKIAQAERQKEIADTKKKQSSHIMSSGSNAPVGTSGVGLRPGMSIDDVIDNELA